LAKLNRQSFGMDHISWKYFEKDIGIIEPPIERNDSDHPLDQSQFWMNMWSHSTDCISVGMKIQCDT
jgi:hypothetical protein